jgi:hypothetical protein
MTSLLARYKRTHRSNALTFESHRDDDRGARLTAVHNARLWPCGGQTGMLPLSPRPTALTIEHP